MELSERVNETAKRLRENVGDAASLDSEQSWLIATDAVRLVTDYIGGVTVPEEVVGLACLQAARELYTQLQAPGGIYSQFGDSAPVRLARDPLKPVYPLLATYVGGGFA